MISQNSQTHTINSLGVFDNTMGSGLSRIKELRNQHAQCI